MERVDRRQGSWVSFRAHAERRPLTVTLTLSLGALPEGWTKSARAYRARNWVGLLGLLLIAPFAGLIGAALLRTAGVASPYDWLAGSNAAILAVMASLLIGIPVAVATSAWRITRVGMRKGSGRLEGLVAVELAPLHLIVVAVAVLCAGLFVGHLVADAIGCVNGVRTAC